MKSFNRNSAVIRAGVTNFYPYTYDFSGSIQNNINDGGNDMFDVGNKVLYFISLQAACQITSLISKYKSVY